MRNYSKNSNPNLQNESACSSRPYIVIVVVAPLVSTLSAGISTNPGPSCATPRPVASRWNIGSPGPRRAGIRHLAKPHKNAKESVAPVTDLLIAVIVLVYVLWVVVAGAVATAALDYDNGGKYPSVVVVTTQHPTPWTG